MTYNYEFNRLWNRAVEWGENTIDIYPIALELFWKKNGKNVSTIKGQVTDADGQPMSNARVSLSKTNIITYTDEKGRYVLPMPNRDSAFIVFMAKGKQSLSYLIDTNIINAKLESINQPVNQPAYIDKATGIVVDEDNRPLPGVSVTVKGTDISAITDLDGNFSISLPNSYEDILAFRLIGMERQELIPSARMSVVMSNNFSQLDQVRVFGYGTAGSGSSLLQGRVAGISVSNVSPEIEMELEIRSASSLSSSSQPLIVIDGVIYEGDMSTIPSHLIKDMSVLKDASATAIYGSRAANGAVIITTGGNIVGGKGGILSPKGATMDKEFLEGAINSKGLRDNFSDYAYWKPDLKTDENGEVKFSVTYPDNVTKWDAFVIAINKKMVSATSVTEVKTYKPLMAQLSTPRFAVETDSTVLMGKVLNYTSDTVQVQTEVYIDDALQTTKEYKIANGKTQPIPVMADNQKDSIKIKYLLNQENGYTDGEERYIPVYPLGTEETKGIFMRMDKDTSFTLDFVDSLGDVEIYAQNNILEILLQEANRLRNYEHLCNEQLASKLNGLLVQKTISAYMDKEFEYDKEINKLIQTLKKRQQGTLQWGWWANSPRSAWITYHTTDALLLAKEMGYKVDFIDVLDTSQYKLPINDRWIENYVWALESDQFYNLSMLKILYKMNIQLDYQKYVNRAEKQMNKREKVSIINKFTLIELKQLFDMPYSINSVLKYEHSTMFGNIYFDDNTDYYHIWNNRNSLTLLAYRILRKANKKDKLGAIRGYLLEERERGFWRNTYESANMLRTIYKDLMEDAKKGKTVLTFAGSINQKVDSFPVNYTVSPSQPLKVSKKGAQNIYFTAYQTWWNATPVSNAKDFVVTTELDSVLVAGKENTVNVTVEVKKDADYVLVEIPIPAGCSYADKKQGNNYETHREYEREKTNIYCTKLRKGNYTFQVKVLPRFSGKYHLNPAKAELMYFPTFYGREGVKEVMIESDKK